ncbi:tRNA (adenosine(37)-N6)-threonylcarbamoyltransferase complex transferase subunit TsaD [Desulfovibrio sp.]
MLCLGIESSCDETAVAVVSEGGLLSERLASQADMHALFGGVVPEIAAREHLSVLPVLCREALAAAGAAPGDLDGVAVARGPGLLGSLLVGLSFAKGFCLGTGARLVGVNHLHAHLLAPGLELEMLFPALGLLVSGGHTHLYRMDSPGSFRLLGRTLDDAAGEAFDKVAKRLNFPYPGGRFLDELAQEAEPDHGLFPRAYIDNDNLDFSFSGLKTAVVTHVDAHPGLRAERMAGAGEPWGRGVDRAALARVCASFNWAVSDTLRIKAERALDRERGIRALVVAGGVAANSGIRAAMRDLARRRGLELFLPSPRFCTDNAAMVAHAGFLALSLGRRHGLDLEAVPRGRAVPEDWLQGAD